MVTNVKMEVTPELSERIQEIVIANGGCWTKGGKAIKNTFAQYLFIFQNKSLGFTENKRYFYDKAEEEEISPYDFIASQGQQKWLPKYGEECEFSPDKQTWSKKLFDTYSSVYKYFYTVDSMDYKYCRPLPKTKIIKIQDLTIEVTKEEAENIKEQLK